MPEVECDDCGWQGSASELNCSEEDYKSDKKIGEIQFNLCPSCGSNNITEIED